MQSFTWKHELSAEDLIQAASEIVKEYGMKYGPNIKIFSCVVDPPLATRFLERNHNNRRLRKSVVQRYASDMARGQWRMKPVPICFDQDGNLGNGQHTLSAIVESGTTHYLLIALDVPRECIAMMDSGLNRSIEDISHFVGAELNSPCAAVAKIMHFGRPVTGAKQAMSFDSLYEVYQFHKEAIDFAVNASNAAKVTGINAITRSVVAQAWYTKDRSRLIDFQHCLKTGIPGDPGDVAAIRLRDLFLKGGGTGDNGIRLELFLKTKSALEHFLDRRPVTRLYGTDRDIFPYPKADV